MAADGSMAVWCIYRADAGGGATAEAHFNYWHVEDRGFITRCLGKAQSDFAEIGILLSDPRQIEKICIFLPFIVSRNMISDCGSYFKSVELAQGIFNEPLTTHTIGPPGPTRVELLKDGSHYCRVHLFNIEQNRIADSELAVEDESGGSIITITRAALLEISNGMTETCPSYFRLRVTMPDDRAPFIQTTRPADRHLQSGYDEIECFDFRLNEARSLPTSVERLMRVEGEVCAPLTRVAFLTAIPVGSELTGTSIPTHKNRVLEHDLWKKYVPRTLPYGMMVYHWRQHKDEGVKDFSAFVKLRIRRSNLAILATYLFIAFAFGVFGNLAASRIDAKLPSTPAPNANQAAMPLGNK